MKLLKKDRKTGKAKIRIENEDDLWRLKDFIRKGDNVRALTQRTKLDGREKKTCTISLEVEKTSYENDRLRVTGEITRGAEDIELGYHTFNLEPGKEFDISREFTESEWKQLEEWEEKRSYEVLFCLVEKGSADFFIVTEAGIKDLSKVEQNIPGKMYPDQDKGQGFYEKVKTVLERSDPENLVLCGPGMQKNKVYNLLSDDLKDKTFLQDTSVTGKTGLHEAIKRGGLEKVVEDSRINEEAQAVEAFLQELEKDGDVEFGEPVEELAEIGAVETLLITPEKQRQKPEMSKKVEQQAGETVLVHTDHEAGERLDSFGGLAAILRYKPN